MNSCTDVFTESCCCFVSIKQQIKQIKDVYVMPNKLMLIIIDW